jgi:hypothetical protein
VSRGESTLCETIVVFHELPILNEMVKINPEYFIPCADLLEGMKMAEEAAAYIQEELAIHKLRARERLGWLSVDRNR